MRKTCFLLALSLASFPVVASAAFGLASSSGVAYVDNTGGAITDFDEGALEDTENVPFLVFEGVEEASFDVDHDGTPGTFSTFSQLAPATLELDNYASYLLHFDPLGQPVDHVNATGFVEFNDQTRIVGVVLLPGADTGPESTTDSLGATDAIYGPGYTYYDTYTYRGLELGNSSSPDGFSIASDGRTFSFDLNAMGAGIDEVRLILQAVPEMSSIVTWSMIAGLGLVVTRARSKKKRRETAEA
ncbi:hypothetical protein CA54_06220 [Symmachiella macrocystis]|uniref:PEP-CTERM protein-sorting domain-containing protein n=1 Tax=Symmachiella macrocystis TaxID=2527985 RepID=A0A5C6BJV0_9PLAN|nr:hypothetical protein [Symmachiella macrocystis]TWU11811.1 hypothetical protein CA54_06220 [Symmachiella macrocystis]